jgi:cytochrome bd-type quinol oxidase subunit 1
MVLLVESLYVRTGDELYRTPAKRWSKVMIASAITRDSSILLPQKV